jgi:hypothetical protein
MYLDVDLTPEYDKKGELLGYHYNNGGWWGSENFRTEMKMGLVQILEADFKPGKYIKKLSIV